MSPTSSHFWRYQNEIPRSTFCSKIKSKLLKMEVNPLSGKESLQLMCSWPKNLPRALIEPSSNLTSTSLESFSGADSKLAENISRRTMLIPPTLSFGGAERALLRVYNFKNQIPGLKIIGALSDFSSGLLLQFTSHDLIIRASSAGLLPLGSFYSGTFSSETHLKGPFFRLFLLDGLACYSSSEEPRLKVMRGQSGVH